MSAVVLVPKRQLTREQFEKLSAMLPEDEWLKNIENENTVRAYKVDVCDFIAFSGLKSYTDLRAVKRSHVIAWRDDMKRRRKLARATIRRKLSALSSLFDYLCDGNAVLANPVDGVERPASSAGEGATPAVSARQARKLLDAPTGATLKAVRDRAILATLLYHGLRCAELCGLNVKDLHSREGVMHFKVEGKRDKIRYIPVNAAAQRLIEAYLDRAGHRADVDGPLFRPVKNNRTKRLDRALDPSAVYKNVVRKYGLATGLSEEVLGLCVHSLRATAATNALSHDSDIAKVQEWLGHADISTTRLYDRRKTKPEDSPTFRIKY
jgi:integrase/recombinase XerD